MTTDDSNFYVTFSYRFSNAVDERTTVRVLFALFIRDLKIRGRRRQRKRGRKREFAFFQSSSRLLQGTKFVKCIGERS